MRLAHVLVTLIQLRAGGLRVLDVLRGCDLESWRSSYGCRASGRQLYSILEGKLAFPVGAGQRGTVNYVSEV